MHRIDTVNKQVDKFGAGKHGFTAGNPVGGVAPTDLSAEFFDAMQEEKARLLEDFGVTLVKADHTQLRQLVRARERTLQVANWTARTSGVVSQLGGIACDGAAGGATWVAVGVTGIVLSSVGGIVWTGRDGAGLVDDFYDVAHKAGGLFVAVGATGKIITSPDGINWTARVSGVGVALHRVCWAGTFWVAVGAGATILTSADGITWASAVSGVAVVLRGVAFGAGLAVVVGDGGTILTSPDGVTWTPRAGAAAVSLYAVAYNDRSGFVIVGSAGAVYTSLAGLVWTNRTLAAAPAFVTVASDPFGGYVAAGVGLYSSDDGVTWTQRWSPVAGAWYGVRHGAGFWIGVGAAGMLVNSLRA